MTISMSQKVKGAKHAVGHAKQKRCVGFRQILTGDLCGGDGFFDKLLVCIASIMVLCSSLLETEELAMAMKDAHDQINQRLYFQLKLE